MAAFFDFYFESSPIMPGHWVFKDEDAREDFTDGAEEEGCMPSLKEIHEGESKEDKAKRKEKEASDAAMSVEEFREEMAKRKAEEDHEREKRQRAVELQKKKLGACASLTCVRALTECHLIAGVGHGAPGEKKARAKLQANARKQAQMQKSLDSLREQLEDASLTDEKREKLKTKMERICSALEKTV